MSYPKTAYEIRKERLARARRRGTHTKTEWLLLIEVCENKCVRCDVIGTRIFKDHIRPIYQPWSHDRIENIQPLCPRCSSAKGPEDIDHRPKDWRQRLDEKLKEIANKLTIAA